MDNAASVDVFFAGKEWEWAICENLRRTLLMRWPNTRARVMKTCISFDDPRPYCYVSYPRKKSAGGILLSISLNEWTVHPRIQMIVPVSAGRFTAHILLTHRAQIDEELLELIALSRR